MLELEESIFTRIPTQPKESKSGQLTKEQLENFFEQGYVVVDDFFDVETELEPLKCSIDDIVDEFAQKLYDEGKIKSQNSDIQEFGMKAITSHLKINRGASVPEMIRKLWTNERLLNIMEQLLGPNIAGHPVWNLRPKTPQTQFFEVPWHQDGGYFEPVADETLLVTTWVPLLDVDEHNGCIQLIPGVHKQNKVGPHKGCWENTWYLYMTDDDVRTFNVEPEKDLVTIRMKYGGLLLFNNLLPHRSLPNLSDDIRWSIDIRFINPAQSTGEPEISGKPPILFRHKDRPDLTPDWDAFDAWNRNSLVEKSGTDPFETTISPELWMNRWPLVHQNEHTEAMKREIEFRSEHKVSSK